MRHVKRGTTICYHLLIYVITTFLIKRVNVSIKLYFARQHTISSPLFWPCVPTPDVCSGADVIRTLRWDQVCPGSKQRIHFPFTLSRAEGVSCLGAGGLLLLLPWLFLFAVPFPPLGLPLLLCPPLPERPPRAAQFNNKTWSTFLLFDAGRRK